MGFCLSEYDHAIINTPENWTITVHFHGAIPDICVMPGLAMTGAKVLFAFDADDTAGLLQRHGTALGIGSFMTLLMRHAGARPSTCCLAVQTVWFYAR